MSSSPTFLRILRQYPLMLVGFSLVILMSSLCFLAPWLVSCDPQTQQTWIDSQGIGFTHPACANFQKFTLQQTAELPKEWVGAQEIRIKTQKRSYKDLRVLLRDGRCHKMFWFEGAQAIDEITLKIGQAFRLYPQAPSTALEKELSLSLGQMVPSELAAEGDQVIFFRVITQNHPVENTLIHFNAQAEVDSILREGIGLTSFSFLGEECIEVKKDGRPLLRTHLLGTDDLGRDLLSRILYGGRISLLVGCVATLVSLIIGVFVGSLAGYLGGRWDRVIMSGVDVLYAIPFMFLVILLLVLFGRSLLILFVALGAVQWLTMSRIVRAQVLALKKLPYIDAARLAGAPSWAIILRHILPNMAGPIIIYTTLTVPSVILEESFLSFIGLTVQYQGQSIDSWGSLVNQGMLSLGQNGDNAGLLIFPSLAMGLTLLGLNLLGDGLRDLLDPRIDH